MRNYRITVTVTVLQLMPIWQKKYDMGGGLLFLNWNLVNKSENNQPCWHHIILHGTS